MNNEMNANISDDPKLKDGPARVSDRIDSIMLKARIFREGMSLDRIATLLACADQFIDGKNQRDEWNKYRDSLKEEISKAISKEGDGE